MKKETPEEVYERCIELALQNCPNDETEEFSYFDVAKFFHSEMLKQSLPTEEKIETEYIKLTPHSNSYYVTFKAGFKAAIELLTKGE